MATNGITVDGSNKEVIFVTADTHTAPASGRVKLYGKLDGFLYMQFPTGEEIRLGGDMSLDIARGIVPGQTSVNKFGHAPTGIQTTATDIWDRADADTTQQIWVAPTAARVHAIVSTSGTDASGSAGAKTLQVYGLTDWDTDEVSEVITMNGDTPVNTVNSYVIIHRMKVLTKGASGPNVGTITATAATDGTVTAAILVGHGQTQMAIYGVPSTQTAYMTRYYASLIGAVSNPATANAFALDVLVNPEPDVELTKFLSKHHNGLSNTATSVLRHDFNPYNKIPGPAIIKLQGVAYSNDLDAAGGFDLILVDN